MRGNIAVLFGNCLLHRYLGMFLDLLDYAVVQYPLIFLLLLRKFGPFHAYVDLAV